MSARKSFFFSFLDRYSSLIIMILSSMIISRLLSPEDIGIYSVSVGLIAIVMAFRDFGAGYYIVTASELDETTVSSVWTVMILFGLFFSVVVFLIGYFSQFFYKTEVVKEVIYVSALSFVLTPFSAVKYAILMRGMQYKTLAIARFSGNFISAILSIGLAFYGFGAVSLAYGNLGSIFVISLVFMFVGTKVNYLRFSFFNLRRIINFGGKLTLANTYKTFVAILPEILIGKFYSFHDAGIFSRGMGLSLMFHRLIVDATAPVILSKFSDSERSGNEIGSLLVHYNSIISLFGWSLLAFIGCNAEVIIILLYGEQWVGAVLYCQLACLCVCLSMLTMNIDTVFLSQHQMKKYLVVVYFTSTLTALSIMLGIFYGPLEILVVLCLSAFISVPVVIYKAKKFIAFEVTVLLLNYFNSLIVAMLVVIANLGVDYYFKSDNYLLELGIHSLLTIIVFAVASFFVSTLFRQEALGMFLLIKSARRH